VLIFNKGSHLAELHACVQGTEAPELVADARDLESPSESKAEATENTASTSDIAESITQALVRQLSSASRSPCHAPS
jgi:hypothetical protein